MPESIPNPREFFAPKLRTPNSLRLFYVAAALAHGLTIDEIYGLTKIDPWFLYQIEEIVTAEKELAAVCSHIPNKGEQMARYYGYYSNVSRGKRQKESSDDAIPCILESQGDAKTCWRKWARLIQKIYETDPLICPKCQGIMRIISFIKEHQIIRDILDHLGIWLVKARPTPKIHDPPIREYAAVDHQRRIHSDDFYGDPNYSWDEYIQS